MSIEHGGEIQSEEIEEIQQLPEPENPEKKFELTPEIIGSVMDKVEDINKYGTAFSVIDNRWPLRGRNKLDSIFRHGLIGTSEEVEGIDRTNFFSPTDKDKYIKTLHSKTHPEVFFNIIGRSGGQFKDYGNYFGWGESHYPKSVNAIAVIFYLNHFKETLKTGRKELDSLTFSPYFGVQEPDPEYLQHTQLNSQGQITTSSEYGFRLSPRVPPRLFRGLVFSMRRKLSEEQFEHFIQDKLRNYRGGPGTLSFSEYEKDVRNREDDQYEPEKRPAELRKRAQEIATTLLVCDKEKPQYLVPIYDTDGNLWWPKQMTYDEVKEFVKERDTEKKQENE